MNIFIFILLAFLTARDHLGDCRKCYTCKFQYKGRNHIYNKFCGFTRDPRASVYVLECASEPVGVPAWNNCIVTSYFDLVRNTVTVFRGCGHSAAMEEEPNCRERMENDTKVVRCVCNYDLCNGSGHIPKLDLDYNHKDPLIHKGYILIIVALDALLTVVLLK